MQNVPKFNSLKNSRKISRSFWHDYITKDVILITTIKLKLIWKIKMKKRLKEKGIVGID